MILMKKNIFATILLLILGFFCSCDKDGTGIDGKYSTLVGCWLDEGYYDNVGWYCEFTKSGLYKDYELDSEDAYYRDGVLYTPASSKWEEDNVGKYDITDGYLTVAGMLGGAKLTIINKDKIDLDGDVLVRIKKFSKK